MARPSIILKFEHDCKAMKRTLRKLKASEFLLNVTQVYHFFIFDLGLPRSHMQTETNA